MAWKPLPKSCCRTMRVEMESIGRWDHMEELYMEEGVVAWALCITLKYGLLA